MISVQGFTIKEKVFENQNTLIYRAISDDTKTSFILKTHRNKFPTNREIAAYRKEFEITSKLQIDGILKSYFLKKNGSQYAIVFEDTDGISLKSFMSNNNLSLQVLMEIFLSIVEVINQIHKNNIIHKDINPLNILIHPKTLKLKIIDFGISSIYSKENIENTSVDFLEGSIPYISPEQTGRMNRPIDYRSDFYSLGITFYELLTGKTPFESNDTLDVIHSHIAKLPFSPYQRAITYYPNKEKVLTKLSDLILRLLAKDPEKRYQSGSGIAYDLTNILEYEKQKDTNEILLLEIGKHDFSGKLQIPAKLFGREEERKILFEAFERILHKSSELVFVNGQPGTGKSALIHELKKEVISVDGFFISGKYEEANRDIPYSGFISASKEFIRQILLANVEEIQKWKDKFLKSLGNSAKLIANVIPELELITGILPPIEDIDETEMANKFHLTFRNFIKTLPNIEHPIIIFLDNFHWADARSFQLLYFFINALETNHILLICAYQTNERNIQSPVDRFIQEAKLEFPQIQNVKLRNLKLEDVNKLVAQTINYPKEKCKELSDLIYFKTNGNPFFVSELLKLIYVEKFLQPVEKKEGGYSWKWNADAIRNLSISDDLADIVTSNLKLLHPDTEKLIQIAACFGHEFTSDDVCLIAEKNKFEVEESLVGAVASGLILVSGNAYRFLHEKVQTTAYSLLDDKSKMQLHAKIAIILLNEYSELEITRQIFAITNHLYLGRDYIPLDFPILKLIELHMEAGKKAKASAAYELAQKQFVNAIYFLESTSSIDFKSLKINAYIEAAECAYLSNQINEMQIHLNKALGETNDLIIKAKVFEIKNKFLITSGNPTQAINNTINLLHELNVHFPRKPKIYHVLISLAKVKLALRKKNIRDLTHYKQESDPKIISIMRLISIIGSAAYFSSPNLLPLLILENVYLSLKHGYTSYTPFSFSAYGIILCGTLGEVEKGFEFGRLSLSIYEDLGGIKNKTKILHTVNSFITHWKSHLKNTIDPLWECYQSGQQTGDLEFAFYGLIQYAFHSFFAGKELSPLEKELNLGVTSLENYNHIYSKYQLKVFQLTLIGLMDPKENPITILPRSKKKLDEKNVDQASLKGNAFYFHFYNLFLNFHFGEYAAGLENANIAIGFSETIKALAIFPVLLFLQSLCLLQEYTNVNFLKRKKYLRIVKSNQRKMKQWSKQCPANFQHKFYLVEAEKNRVLNNTLLAIDYYELAIQFAKEGDFLQEIALANELAGNFFMRVNKPNLAKSYLNSGLYYYHIWGAIAKVKQFEKLYPGIVESIYEDDKHSKKENTTSIVTQIDDTESFNLATMIKVSEAISREILLEKVLASLIKTLIENAGAERGVLILEKENKLFIEAEESFGKAETSILQSIPLENADLPLTIINYTIRFGEYIVLNDAMESEQFSKDPYVIKNKSRSILCFPIFHKQSLFGIFYLENNLSSYAFKKNSIEFLIMISSQSAISIENARLYASLESRVNERTKELDASLNQQYTLNENLMRITRELNQSFQKIKKDLALAKKIQDSILPKNLEKIESLNISTFYSPMDEVGGDFFDITEVSERKIRIFLADATGHGIQGALITMAIKSEYESLKSSISSPSELLGTLNNEFLRKFKSINAFFTCILLDIDPVNGILQFAAAGHPPQILIQHGNMCKLTSTGKIIGINENVKYRESEFPFAKGDKIFLYSDGIFEEFNYVRDEFGEEKLWSILKEHGNISVSETLNSVVQQVDDFLGNLPQEDDMTFIGIEYRL